MGSRGFKSKSQQRTPFRSNDSSHSQLVCPFFFYRSRPRNLYIAFHVQFPKKLDEKTTETLRKLLPGADVEAEYDPAEVEEHLLDAPADLRHFGKGGAATADDNEYDSDDERGGPGGVQCQQS